MAKAQQKPQIVVTIDLADIVRVAGIAEAKSILQMAKAPDAKPSQIQVVVSGKVATKKSA